MTGRNNWLNETRSLLLLIFEGERSVMSFLIKNETLGLDFNGADPI